MSLVVAVAEGGVIGRGGDLPWRLGSDLARFKRLTMGHHLIVGRRTWESIGRPLPGRSMVVVSRGRPAVPVGVALAGSLGEALDAARAAGETEAFVGGGAALYREALPLADRLYLTRVHAAIAGDTYFPEPEAGEWREVAREELPAGDRDEHPSTFFVLERVR